MQDSGFKKNKGNKIIPQEHFVYTRGGEPKVMKKVVNSVLASALALSVAPMVVGAEEAAPQVDADLQKTLSRLSALGLVVGDGKGDFGVDRTITRAEFATLVVRARGLEQGAKLAQYQSNFTDVNSSDWFAGYVNVASGQEIVKGYTDKSFKPQAQVTYAEAVAMIIRALGYDPSVRGVWPNSYIAKASELGIAKGISQPNKAATRGDVFKMLDNALTVDLMEQVEFGTDVRFEVKEDENLLNTYLDITLYDMDWADDEEAALPVVSNVPVVGLGDLKANEVTLSGKDGAPNGTYEVSSQINVNNFAGQHVQVWVKDDSEDTVVWMEPSADEEVINDRFDTFYYKGKVVKAAELAAIKAAGDDALEDLEVKLSNGKKYEFASKVNVTFNFNRFEDDWLDAFEAIGIDWDNLDAYEVKLVLNDDGDITYISVLDDRSGDKSDSDDYKYGSEVIEKIDAEKKKITVLDGDSVEVEGDEGEDFLVIRNGQNAKFADLQPFDVFSVYYADGDKDKKIIIANSTVVEGVVQDVETRIENSRNSYFLKIGDKKYRVRATTYSEDNNETIISESDDVVEKLESLDGEEVKIHLDPSGRVRHLVTKASLKDRKVTAVISKDVVYDFGKDNYSFKVYNENDKEVTITIDDLDDFDGDVFDGKTESQKHDWIVDNLKTVTESNRDTDAPVVVEYELDKDGDIKDVEIVDNSDFEYLGTSEWDDAADEDDNIVTIGGEDYKVDAKTPVFDLSGDISTRTDADGNDINTLEDVDLASFDEIDEEDYAVWAYTDGDDVEALFVVDTNGKGVSSDAEFGLVNANKTRTGDDLLEVVKADGTTVELKVDGDVEDYVKGDFIAYQATTDLEVDEDDITLVADTNNVYYGPVVDDAADATSLDTRVQVAQSQFDELNLDKITPIRVDEIDGNKLVYNGINYNVNDKTVYFNPQGVEKVSDIDEGDYVILVDTDDTGASYDYVVFVASEEEVEDYNMEDEVAGFLAQGQAAVPAAGSSNSGELLAVTFSDDLYDADGEKVTSVTASDFEFKNVSVTSVTYSGNAVTFDVYGAADNATITSKFTDKLGNVWRFVYDKDANKWSSK